MSQNSTTTEDTIDLKELFFSLIAQWKIIALCIILSLICALLYLRVTPDVYSVDAMVQVEDSKSAASAALLGELSSVAGAVGGQKSPADAEREILNSRLVLGQVIQNLHLDIQIKDTQDTLFNRLVSESKRKLDYSQSGVLFKENGQSFFVEKFEV